MTKRKEPWEGESGEQSLAKPVFLCAQRGVWVRSSWDMGRFPFSQNFRNFRSAVNGTRFIGSSHWKIPRKKWKIWKGGLLFPVGISERNFVFHSHVSRSLYQFQVHGKKMIENLSRPVSKSKWLPSSSCINAVCFFAGSTVEALLHHECADLGLIGKYLVMSNSNIYSEVHIYWVESLQFFCWHDFPAICSLPTRRKLSF